MMYLKFKEGSAPPSHKLANKSAGPQASAANEAELV